MPQVSLAVLCALIAAGGVIAYPQEMPIMNVVWMGLVYSVFSPGPHRKPGRATHWFMMQIVMVIGFVSAYSMNRRLIRRGFQEAM